MKNKALLVSRLSTAVNVLKDLLAENSYEVENVVSDTKSALEYANDTVYDIVVINAPKAGKFYGGTVSGPAFSEIMSRALQLYNIKPDVPLEKEK